MAFLDVLFPTDISRGAVGGPVWSTTILESPSGYEQAIQHWDEPKLEFDFDAEFWDESRIQALLSFFHAVAGMANSFRFRDWSDYYIGMTAAPGGPAYSTPQQIGTGNGSATQFQIAKVYTAGSYSRTRKITKPVSGSVKVYVAGVEQTSGVTVDHSTGVVTLSAAPSSGASVAVCCKFDCHARFASDRMPIKMDAVLSGAWTGVSIVGVRD